MFSLSVKSAIIMLDKTYGGKTVGKSERDSKIWDYTCIMMMHMEMHKCIKIQKIK